MELIIIIIIRFIPLRTSMDKALILGFKIPVKDTKTKKNNIQFEQKEEVKFKNQQVIKMAKAESNIQYKN